MDKYIEKYGALAIVGGVAVWYILRKVGAVAEAAIDEVNPLSDDNVVYDNIIGGTGRAITGDDDWTLGGQIWDWSHAPYEGEQGAESDTVWGYLFGGNSTGTLGTDIYDWINGGE